MPLHNLQSESLGCADNITKMGLPHVVGKANVMLNNVYTMIFTFYEQCDLMRSASRARTAAVEPGYVIT